MKKTVITSLNIGLLAFLLLGAPTFAQTAADLTASATKDTPAKEVAPKPKTEPLATRKQKIEVELRATVSKLQVVIDRTQVVIDLLAKNNKDVTAPAKLLSEAKASLKDAVTALDQFAGVAVPEVKADAKVETKSETKASEKLTASTIVLLKDPLKKAEEALKDSKASLTGSIAAIKDILTPKEDSE